MNDSQHTAIIRLKTVFYPKGKKTSVNSGEFCIFLAEICDTNISPFSSKNNIATQKIKLKGTLTCNLDTKSEYKVIFEDGETNQYGTTYSLIHITRNVDLDNEKGIENFLSSFISNKVLENLYEYYGSKVMDIIRNKDINSLLKVTGIGNKTAKKIIDEYENHKDYELIYHELGHLQLTKPMIDKLVGFYGSPEKVIQVIKSNPYTLVKVDRIGFKKADSIALKDGMPYSDKRRIKGFLYYNLENQAENGKSYLTYDQVMLDISKTLGNIPEEIIIDSLKEMIKSNEIITLQNGQIIALKKIFELENKIAKELERINNAPLKDISTETIENAIITSEKLQGFPFTQEQRKAIRESIHHNVIAITGGAGCVDGDTEFLTPNGWKKISEYNEKDLVLQYNSNGTTEFVSPTRYIKQPCKTLYYFHNSRLNQVLSYNHMCWYIGGNNILVNKPFYEIAQIHNQARLGFVGRFITGFSKYNNIINIDDNILILYTIIILKGRLISNENGKYLYGIKLKELHNYKRDLLIKTLKKLNIKYTDRYKHSSGGYSWIYFNMEEKIDVFPSEWYNLNSRQFSIVLDIVRNYCNKRVHEEPLPKGFRFTTTQLSKENADFIQFAIACTGHNGEIFNKPKKDMRYSEGVSTKNYYYVRYNTGCLVTMKEDNPNEKILISEYNTKDGFEYCFTVPSGALVLRRKNKIFVTGNCGKTTTANGIFSIYNKDKIIATALSGKASVRINETTGLEAGTIHRTLGFKPNKNNENCFTYNKSNPFPNCDMVLVDESTMVNGSVFLSLLNAIPSGAKLVLLGDIQQLTPIGNCQVFNDILKCSQFEKVQLTEPHRQAKKSGIIITSQEIARQKQIFSAFNSGELIYGELKDMIVRIQPDKTTILKSVIDSFFELYDKSKDIIETQIILPIKARGELSCFTVNTYIQNVVNKNTSSEYIRVFVSKSQGENNYYYIKVGDKVINTKNNYNCYTPDEEPISVFNGNIGIVESISDDQAIVNFVNLGRVVIESDYYDNLALAYALTIHKCQGSEFKNVIIGLDDNSYLLNNSELLYTAITRAKEKCILVGTNSCIQTTIRKKECKTKQTFLATLLTNM